MNRKFIKKIIVSMIVVLFALPIAAAAQVQTRYEHTPTFSQEELAQLLAPVALYPDALLSQVLIAASYPYEVVEADRWLARNPYLTDEQMDTALKTKDWDISVLSLCHYPKVLNMMAENLTWTAKLGDAFVYQKQEVMDTIQDLRARAAAHGNLTTTNEQRVIVEERIIRIEPAYYNYLYVPVYDPYVVYGQWWFPAFLPFRIFYPGVVVAGPRIVFSPRLFVSFGVIGWSHFDWHARHIIIRDIDRTKRFNRHYQAYRGHQEKVYWKPNQHKRVAYERRRQEQPHFRHTERSPGRAPSGDFKRGAGVVVPPRSKSGVPAAPPAIKKNHRPVVAPENPGRSSASSDVSAPRGKESPKGQSVQTLPQSDAGRVKVAYPPVQPQPGMTKGGQQGEFQHAPGNAGRNFPNTPRSSNNRGSAIQETQQAERGMHKNTGTGRAGGRDSSR